MRGTRHPPASGISLLVIVASGGLAVPAFAWETKGHIVIEAVANRTLVEGRGGVPPRPCVLRDLINDEPLLPDR
jgi:hypothetical protein